MRLNLALQIELGDAPQILAQDFFLDLKLMLIADVLVLASAAAAEMWTERRDAVRRRLYDCTGVRTGKAGFFFGDYGFDVFPGEDKGNKDSFAASAVLIAVRSGRKTSESVAAIDQLFNV